MRIEVAGSTNRIHIFINSFSIEYTVTQQSILEELNFYTLDLTNLLAKHKGKVQTLSAILFS